MDKTWLNYGEYLLRWLQAQDWQSITIACLAAAMVCIAFWYNSPGHLERAVSKRKIQARHRKVKEIAAQVLTEALEEAHVKGILKRNEVDHLYRKIEAGTGIRELGNEPSFGRPWYYGPEVTLPDFAKKKAEIMKRLQSWGVDVVSKLKRSKPGKKKDELLTSIKKVA